MSIKFVIAFIGVIAFAIVVRSQQQDQQQQEQQPASNAEECTRFCPPVDDPVCTRMGGTYRTFRNRCFHLLENLCGGTNWQFVSNGRCEDRRRGSVRNCRGRRRRWG